MVRNKANMLEMTLWLPWRRLLSACSVLMCCLVSFAQSGKGTITPVDSDDEAPQKPVLHYYDKHGERLETPVLYLAELDTVTNNGPRSPYPLLNGFSVGVNFGDAILSLIGQTHYSYDVSAMMSFHNWFFPVIEAGVGWGRHTESGDLYKVKAKPSFYGKIGINYNFLYKSNPDYMAYVGLRFGFSNHKWDVTDIKPTVKPDEGGGTDNPDAGGDDDDNPESGKVNGNVMNKAMTFEPGVTEMLGQSCTSIYGELVAGLKVRIAGPFSLGWNVRYRVYKHNSKKAEPWFIPGYGTGPLGVNICAYLTFGQKPRRDAVPIPETLPMPENNDASNPAADNHENPSADDHATSSASTIEKN